MLDFTSLKLAIGALNNAVHSYKVLSKNTSLTINDIETVKSGVIQNFEVAYEQCWKMMKRWIEENVNPDIVNGVTRRQLFRVSAENRLIVDVDVWMDFHTSRNLTSHTYSQDNAEITFQAALLFLPEAQEFLARLEMRNDG